MTSQREKALMKSGGKRNVAAKWQWRNGWRQSKPWWRKSKEMALNNGVMVAKRAAMKAAAKRRQWQAKRRPAN